MVEKISTTDRFLLIKRRQQMYRVVQIVGVAGLMAVAALVIYKVWLKEYGVGLSFLDKNVKAPSYQELSEKRIINPQYQSFDSHNVPFKFTAKVSTEIDADHIHLESPEGLYHKNPQESALRVRATQGVLTKTTQHLDLMDGVTLIHGDMTFTTPTIAFDTKNRQGVGVQPIQGGDQSHHLTAGAFEIADHGTTLIFTRGATNQRPTLTITSTPKGHK